MRVSNQKLNITLKKQIARTLLQTIVDLKDFDETNRFFENFFNESELETFAKRLAIAYWLKKGRSYTNIKENLKVSSATIASIQSQLDSPGFQLALTKIEAEEWATKWSQKIQKFVGK